MYLLVSKKYTFSKVTKCKNLKDFNEKVNKIKLKKNEMIWSTQSSLFKKGDPIPFANNEKIRLVKIYIKKTNYKQKYYEKDSDKNLESIKKLINNLTKDKISNVEKIVLDLKRDEEVYYRIFYNSFKMYRIREYCFILAQSLKYLLEDDYLNFDEKKYKNTLNLSSFDSTLRISLEKVFDTQFTLDCNNQKKWAEDAVVLAGTYNLFLKAVENILKILKDFYNKKGVLFDKEITRPLEWHEAAAMEVYLPLREIRYNSINLRKYLNL